MNGTRRGAPRFIERLTRIAAISNVEQILTMVPEMSEENIFSRKGYQCSEIRKHAYEILDETKKYEVRRRDSQQIVFNGTWKEALDWIAYAPDIGKRL